MYEEVVNFMMMLTPAPAIAAVIFGICYGVIEYMNDDLELFLAILTPGLMGACAAGVWVIAALMWPLTIVLVIIFGTAFLIKRYRSQIRLIYKALFL